jgi:hypothetical protein
MPDAQATADRRHRARRRRVVSSAATGRCSRSPSGRRRSTRRAAAGRFWRFQTSVSSGRGSVPCPSGTSQKRAPPKPEPRSAGSSRPRTPPGAALTRDGAQQELVHVVITFSSLGQVGVGPEMCAMRELSAGIHPTILTTRGLRAALEALGDRLRLPVRPLEVLPEVRLPRIPCHWASHRRRPFSMTGGGPLNRPGEPWISSRICSLRSGGDDGTGCTKGGVAARRKHPRVVQQNGPDWQTPVDARGPRATKGWRSAPRSRSPAPLSSVVADSGLER